MAPRPGGSPEGSLCEDRRRETACCSVRDSPEIPLTPRAERWRLANACGCGGSSPPARYDGNPRPAIMVDGRIADMQRVFHERRYEDSLGDCRWRPGSYGAAVATCLWLLGRKSGSISWRGSITLDIASLYIPGGVSSFEVEKPSTGASSLSLAYFDRFALKDGTREEAPVLRFRAPHVNPPTYSAEEPKVLS